MSRKRRRNDPPQILSTDEFVELLDAGGWQLTGGAYAKVTVEALGFLSVEGARAHSLGVQIPVRAPGFKDIYDMPHGQFVLTRPELHIVHVSCVFPQKQQGKGGVMREVPQFGVWLKFVNLGIKEQEKAKKAEREAEEQRARDEKQRQFLSFFSHIIGARLESMRVSDEGAIVHLRFDNGQETYVSSRGELLLGGMLVKQYSDLVPDPDVPEEDEE